MRHLRPLVAAAVLLATAPVVSATVLLPGDLADLTRGAAAIVRGRVVEPRTEWVSGRRRVETIVTFSVDESFKGDFSGQVTVAVPGGVMGRYRSLMIGAPSFRQGEEVILFLGAKPPQLPYVLGLGQGVFRILRDARSGQTMVTPPALLADATDTVAVTRGDPSRRTVSLDEFSATLRSVVAGGWARRPAPDRTAPVVIKGGR